MMYLVCFETFFNPLPEMMGGTLRSTSVAVVLELDDIVRLLHHIYAGVRR
jgi:hypothetical protein